MRLYLGIDLGTTGVRSAIIDEEKKLISLTDSEISPTIIKDNNPVQDPHSWWVAVTSTLRQHEEILQSQGLALRQVVALSVDGTSGTMLMTDENLSPLTDGLMYHSNHFPKEGELVNQWAPENSIVRSKSSGLARLLYLQNLIKSNSLLTAPRYCLSQSDWILAKLMGVGGLADENNTLKWGYDLEQECWPDWFEKTGVNMDILPKVERIGQPLGVIDTKVANDFKFNHELVCISGTTDGNAAFLASGAKNVGDGVTSLGTTLTIKLISDSNCTDFSRGIYSHRLNKSWLVGGASNSGGGVLLRYFTVEQIRELSKKINPEEVTGLDYYPLIQAGERFPINDATFTGNLMPRPASEVRFLQGMLEGVARVEKMGYEMIKKIGGSEVERVFTVGGGAQNQVWSRIRENFLEVPMHSVVHEQAAYGTALLAMGL